VAAILAAHVGAAFAGGYLGVTGPAPLRFQSQTASIPLPTAIAPGPALAEGVSTNSQQADFTGDEGASPCSTNTPSQTAATDTVTNAAISAPGGAGSSAAAVVGPEPATAASSQGQPAEERPLTSQVLAEIFRHISETSTNESATPVVPAGFMPPLAPPRSSSATYTDH